MLSMHIYGPSWKHVQKENKAQSLNPEIAKLKEKILLEGPTVLNTGFNSKALLWLVSNKGQGYI